jgi:hypothetical protein
LPDGRDLPAGALSLLADGGQPGDTCWLRCDPVHLRVNGDQLVLAEHRVFEISQGEAEGFTDALNRHFAEDGFVFYPLRPERWYLRAPVSSDILTTPLGEAVGRHIDPLLPRGPEALVWHRLFNEIQMLLHGVPLNADRESGGALTINSVWLWGVGRLPTAIGRPYALVVTDDPVARGLASAAGSATASPDRGLQQVIADQPRGEVLLYDPTLDLLRAYSDEAGVAATLERLEQSVFAPLLAALKRGAVERVRIVTFAGTHGVCFESTRASLWRFWRSAMALSDYAGPAV